jgi:hypothetical protein
MRGVFAPYVSQTKAAMVPANPTRSIAVPMVNKTREAIRRALRPKRSETAPMKGWKIAEVSR